MECPVRFYDPGTGSKPDRGVLLDKSCLKFVAAREVALVEEFVCMLVFRESMRHL
jgi:hypothetical protein